MGYMYTARGAALLGVMRKVANEISCTAGIKQIPNE